MPRIKTGDPILGGFVPSLAMNPLKLPKLFGPAWGDVSNAASWKRNAFAEANYGQWAQITGHVVGQLGVLDGVPGWAAQGFGDFFAMMPTVRPSDIATTVLGTAAKSVSIALGECYTAIPIIGWVVQLGIGIYQAIDAALKAEKAWKESQKPPPGRAIIFDSADNEAISSAMVSQTSEPDWTPLFLPPTTRGDWSARHITWIPGTPGQGWAIGIRADLGAGLVPGAAECLGSLDPGDGNGWTNYQFANKTQGALFGAEYDLPPLITSGELTPSTRQLSILLWQSVMKPSVAMFRVDSNAVQSAWLAYFEGLVEFAATLRTDSKVENVKRGDAWERGLNPKLAYNEVLSATSYLAKVMNKDGELELLYPTKELSPKNPGNLPWLPDGISMLDLTEYGELTYTPADIIRYNCTRHRLRAFAALKTLVCAYVPPNAPLLASHAALAKTHDDMRRLLLDHRAVNDVELDLIPDSEYRAAVSQAQHRNSIVADVGFGAKGPGGEPPHKGKPGEPPTVDGSPPPQMPDSPAPALPGRYKGGTGGGGAALPIIGFAAVAAVTGFLVLRKRRR